MVAGDLNDKYGCICMFNQWWEVLPDINKEWDCADHGGYFETSMMMAVNPEIVSMDLAKAAPTNKLTDGIVSDHGWRYKGGVIPIPIHLNKVHPYGNVGHAPFGANAELGQKMIEVYVEFNVALVNELKKIEI
jgi:creatinine amidohydrolase